LIEHFLFSVLDLVLWRFIEVLDVLGIEKGSGDHELCGGGGPALQEIQLAQALFQALAATPEGLENCLRG
jgi:hypothetical protein